MFDKKIEPRCEYCRYGTDIGNSEVACVRRGIMTEHGFCAAFIYEPTKRNPHVMGHPDIGGFTEEDFSIE